jgi:hypothetical protein
LNISKEDSTKGDAKHGISLFAFWDQERDTMSFHPPVFSIFEEWDLLQKAVPGSQLSDFHFGMPLNRIEKADDPKGRRFIEGVASTPAEDLQKERVIQKGLDIRYFLTKGYFNNDHKPGFHNKVGQPTKAEIKRIKDIDGKSVLGLWVEGYLWAKGTHDVADSIWELAQALEASGAERQLGFSIQGKVLQRDGNKILKAWIQDVAVTPSPVNTKTWMSLVQKMEKSKVSVEEAQTLCKSIEVDQFAIEPAIEEPNDNDDKALTVSGGAAVVPESLDENLKNQVSGRPFFGGESETEVQKSLRIAYRVLRDRGYGHKTSYYAAQAAVAKTLLHSLA